MKPLLIYSLSLLMLLGGVSFGSKGIKSKSINKEVEEWLAMTKAEGQRKLEWDFVEVSASGMAALKCAQFLITQGGGDGFSPEELVDFEHQLFSSAKINGNRTVPKSVWMANYNALKLSVIAFRQKLKTALEDYRQNADETALEALDQKMNAIREELSALFTQK